MREKKLMERIEERKTIDELIVIASGTQWSVAIL